ncbi:hypothetical protein WL50_07570, partial [Burkholderia ubonensis]
MVEPGVRTFDHPTILAETAAMFGPALRDHGFDTALAQRATVSGGIVAAIGVDDAGLLKRSATDTANWWNRINERQQLRDVVGVRASQDCDDGNVVGVRASQDCDDGNAVGVYEDVVLGTRSRAIRGVRASFSPAPTARTDDESTAAYDRSIWPAARNLSSSNSCSWSHTPAFCQSLNRRQQVAPEPKPSRVGKWFQRIPVLNTNRMPLSAARSDTRGRPGSLFARGFAGGSNGSISIHSSSSMIGASILGLPLF